MNVRGELLGMRVPEMSDPDTKKVSLVSDADATSMESTHAI